MKESSDLKKNGESIMQKARNMALSQPRAVMMSEVPVTIKGHVDTQGLVLCWCLRATLLLGSC